MRRFFLFIVVGLVFGFSSCDDSIKSDIIGAWICNWGHTWDFKANGNFYHTFLGDGKYNVNGNVLTINNFKSYSGNATFDISTSSDGNNLTLKTKTSNISGVWHADSYSLTKK